MAVDSWVPHRFATLSERLVTQNGVLLMGIAAAGAADLHRAARSTLLVVMYSINVFLTFSLSSSAWCAIGWPQRHHVGPWRRHWLVTSLGAVVTGESWRSRP